MNTLTKIGCLSAFASILGLGASYASGKPPQEDKTTAEKVGREAARVKEQVSGAAHDVKQGFKEGEKDLKAKYRHDKK